MLRRLALIGIATCTAGSLLTGCGASASESTSAAAPGPSASSSGTSAGTSSPTNLPGRGPNTPTGDTVTFAGPSGPLRGVWAAPVGKPKGAVLVVHDDQGLTPHFADVVGRFAGAGYATLAVDLLSAQGGAQGGATATATDPTQARMALATLTPDKLIGGMRAGIVELGRRAPGTKVGAVGFGFGAGALWQLLASGDKVLAAAVPFYGATPEDANFSGSHAAVLAMYPANDPKLGEAQDNADMAMLNANLVHNSTLYPDTDAGFFDDSGTHYNAGAATKAWQATLDWFGQYLVPAPGAAQAASPGTKSPAVKTPTTKAAAHRTKTS